MQAPSAADIVRLGALLESLPGVLRATLQFSADGNLQVAVLAQGYVHEPHLRRSIQTVVAASDRLHITPNQIAVTKAAGSAGPDGSLAYTPLGLQLEAVTMTIETDGSRLVKAQVRQQERLVNGQAQDYPGRPELVVAARAALAAAKKAVPEFSGTILHDVRFVSVGGSRVVAAGLRFTGPYVQSPLAVGISGIDALPCTMAAAAVVDAFNRRPARQTD